MTVRVRGLGALRKLFGDRVRSVSLESGGRLRDLMRAIEEEWGDASPPELWNRDTDAAGRAIVILVDGRQVSDLNTPLRQDQEIIFLRVSVGG